MKQKKKKKRKKNENEKMTQLCSGHRFLFFRAHIIDLKSFDTEQHGCLAYNNAAAAVGFMSGGSQ